MWVNHLVEIRNNRQAGAKKVTEKREKRRQDSNKKDDVVTDSWCVCGSPESGEMLGCDSKSCAIEWYHLQCTGFSQAPDEDKWFCPFCK